MRISKALKAARRPWAVEFEYLTEGISYLGAWYPIVKMEWIVGTGLIRFIEANLWNSQAIASVATKFAGIAQDLQRLGIAHGDLQHGNLLVAPSGEVKLIDYDGMFVPSLESYGSSELGHPNYQSPARGQGDWGPHLDNFSSGLIYTSLVALTLDPTLWMRLHQDGDEALLLRKDDFLLGVASPALLAFNQNSDTRIQSLAQSIKELLVPDVRRVPIFNPSTMPKPSIESPFGSPSAPMPSDLRTGGAGGSAMPEWITAAPAGGGYSTAASPTAEWLSGHLPPLPIATFSASRRPLRISIGIWAACSLVVSLAGFPVAIIVLLPILFLASIVLYRATPEAKGRISSRVGFDELRREAKTAVGHVADIESQREDLGRDEAKQIQVVTKKARDAVASEQRELADITHNLGQRLAKLGTQRQQLRSEETTEVGNLLRARQAEYVHGRLTAVTVRGSTIPGIGDALVTTLAAHGVRTAADFMGVSHMAVPTRSGSTVRVCLNLRDGRRIHPRGIGETKAAALEAWRRKAEMAVRAHQPVALAATEMSMIRATYMQKEIELGNQENSARMEAAVLQGRIRDKWSSVHPAIQAELTAVRVTFRQQQEELAVRLVAGRRAATDAQWRRAAAERQLHTFRDVSYRRYVTGVLSR